MWCVDKSIQGGYIAMHANILDSISVCIGGREGCRVLEHVWGSEQLKTASGNPSMLLMLLLSASFLPALHRLKWLNGYQH
jgi:hypothetical protein